MGTEQQDLPLATSSLRQAVKLRIGEEGEASLKPLTVFELFDNTVKKYGNRPALHQKIVKQGEDAKDISYTTWTWSQYRSNIDQFAKALLSIGFEPFDVINILGFNSREWYTANFGAIAAGGVSSGIYATNSPEACKYISEHSKAKVVVCEGSHQLKKYFDISSQLSELKAIVVYGPDVPSDEMKGRCAVPVYTFAEFLALGNDIPDSAVKKRVDALKPNHVCTLIYTSGTTGSPKAVMITHDNLTWTSKVLIDCAVPKGSFGPDDCGISYLPLSHVAAQILDMYCSMLRGAQVYFAQNDALKGSLIVTLREVRPSIFFGVPRVWEKMYERMQEVARSNSGIKRMIATWAKNKASSHWDACEFGSSTRSPQTYFLSRMIMKAVHQRLGLDRSKAFFVAAAPMDVKILRYFASIDIPVMEVFGQSECTGPHTVNSLDAFKLGTVGRPLLGTKTRIDPETGELIYYGRHVFAGYMNAEDQTNQTVDPNGWLHSGDVTTIDNDDHPRIAKPSGFITVTGRIKELIITAGGENIPPVPIEDQMKAAMPVVANCMVVGERRKFLTALICLHVEMDESGMPTNKLTGTALLVSEEIGSLAKSTDAARKDKKWIDYIDEGVKKANEKATSRAQLVRKWALLSGDFTEPGGELTPTLKLKRKVAEEIHKTTIEELYKIY